MDGSSDIPDLFLVLNMIFLVCQSQPKPSQANFHQSACRFENALTVFGFAKAYNKSNEVKK